MVVFKGETGMNFKKLLNFRIIILILLIILSLVWINPGKSDGVTISEVVINGSSYDAGIRFDSSEKPKDREVIFQINNQKINSIEDFQRISSSLELNSTFRILTNKQEYPIYLNKELGLTVEETPSSNLVRGLDLVGGTRIILTPEEKVSSKDFSDLVSILDKRLNAFGFRDVSVKSSGSEYIIVEVAGVTKSEIEELVSQQGKFEAKIGEKVVFIGGKKDVVFVCKDDGTCSGIRSCDETSDGAQCVFEFRIGLSAEAAQRQADATKELDINISAYGTEYLSKPLELYLDDNLVDTLQISASLKGLNTKDIIISGPGHGLDENEAIKDSLANMQNLQTILITGSLPVKLEIVRVDSVSPILGEVFTKEAFTAGGLALLTVALVILIRYRKFKISIPLIIISSSEVLIILGFAAATSFNLDLATIVGIIAAVGTGVDDLIVITDEALSGGNVSSYDWKTKLKRAFFVITVAYFTTVAAMLPLTFVGAGLLTGFAIATITGVTVGVLISRPAYASIIKFLIHKED